jgi:hypothetical protein
MRVSRWKDVNERDKVSPGRRAVIRKELEDGILEADLRGIRELLGKTQAEVDDALKISQGQVSETERRLDIRVSTLRRYVASLGGNLELVAHFGSRSYRVTL